MSSQPTLLLLKLGGAIITDKERPMTVRSDVLRRLVQEVARARQELGPDVWLIIGHGSGSFAHVPAKRYGTMDGFQDADGRLGMAIVQDAAAQLNRIVVEEFLHAAVPAVSLYPSNTVVLKDRQVLADFPTVGEAYLHQGLVPVTCGDVLVDTAQGCTIWSTEDVLAHWAKRALAARWRVLSVVHVTEVVGVLDAQGNLAPTVTPASWPSIEKAITETKGVDVTGGMGKKLVESLSLAKMGVHSKILSGLTENNLFQALVGEPWVGTTVHA